MLLDRAADQARRCCCAAATGTLPPACRRPVVTRDGCGDDRHCRRRHCRDGSSTTMPASPWPPCAPPACRHRPGRGRRTPNGRPGCNACTAGLPQLLPPDWELWLDGGHNPGAGVVLAEHLARLGGPAGACGGRDEAGEGFGGVPAAAAAAGRPPSGRCAEPDQHAALPVEAIIAASGGVARPGPRVADALRDIRRNRRSGPGADLRQPVSGGRGPEAGRRLECHSEGRGALVVRRMHRNGDLLTETLQHQQKPPD